MMDAAQQNKTDELKVYQVNDEGQYFVESSKGKICYKVWMNNGSKVCTCADYTSNGKDHQCKHILAVISRNGNSHRVKAINYKKPKLDDRFVMKIKGNEFVKYSGVLDCAHQIGIQKISIELLQYPTSDNGKEAICEATVISNTGEEYKEIGDANPTNVSSMVVNHIIRVAATRAKARAFRDMTNIGMTCLEELGDVSDDDLSDKSSTAKYTKKTAPKKTEPQKSSDVKTEVKPAEKKPEPQKPDEKPSETKSAKPNNGKQKMSEAQKRAILNIAERRGIKPDELSQMAEKAFAVSFEFLNAEDASAFIRELQQTN